MGRKTGENAGKTNIPRGHGKNLRMRGWEGSSHFAGRGPTGPRLVGVARRPAFFPQLTRPISSIRPPIPRHRQGPDGYLKCGCFEPCLCFTGMSATNSWSADVAAPTGGLEQFSLMRQPLPSPLQNVVKPAATGRFPPAGRLTRLNRNHGRVLNRRKQRKQRKSPAFSVLSVSSCSPDGFLEPPSTLSSILRLVQRSAEVRNEVSAPPPLVPWGRRSSKSPLAVCSSKTLPESDQDFMSNRLPNPVY